jgi:hypothetical protein
MNIGASDFVLDTIRNGYVIPFVNPPVSMYVSGLLADVADKTISVRNKNVGKYVVTTSCI